MDVAPAVLLLLTGTLLVVLPDRMLSDPEPLEVVLLEGGTLSEGDTPELLGLPLLDGTTLRDGDPPVLLLPGGRTLSEGDPLDNGLPLEFIAVGNDPELLELGEPPELSPVSSGLRDDPLPPDDGPVPTDTPVGLLVRVTISSVFEGADPEPDADRVTVAVVRLNAELEFDAGDVNVGPVEDESLNALAA